MKKNLLLIFVLIWLIKYAQAQTTVSGGQVSGTWTKINSPYLVTGAIMVANGSTLTIQPGVKVEFQGNYKFMNLGQIIAVGAINDSIIFTSQNTSTGWLGIKYDNTPTSNDSSKFRYCIFEYGNTTSQTTFALSVGGMFYFSNFSKAIISNSRFSNCKAASGGAIRCGGSNIQISNNIFSNNSANSSGAIECNFSQAIISNNLFINNTSTGTSYSYGGALSCWDNPSVYNNIFINNSSLASDYSGGAMYCGSSSAVKIYNNKFSNNQSPNSGGGAIYCYANNSEIYNNLIVNNSSLIGGGVYCEGSPNIYNNTIANNYATNYGGAMYFKDASPNIKNTIIWGNTSSAGSNQFFLDNENSDPNFYYCDIEGGQAGIGMNSNIFYLGNYSNNITLNPQFNNPSIGSGYLFDGLTSSDWTLNATSGCINTGDPSGLYPSIDLNSNPRIVSGIIDIGAYEYSSIINIIEHNNTMFSNLYPNPSTGNFTIELNTKEKQSIQVFDITGNVVISQTIENGKVIIDANHLASGIYNVNIKGSNSVANKKLVIIK